MNSLKMGVIGTSKKVDERRFPIHPEHLLRIPEDLRRQLIFEEGYGEPFNISDSEIAEQTGGRGHPPRVIGRSWLSDHSQARLG